jgi:hypothetical protein
LNLRAPHIIPGTLAAAALIAAVATTVTTTVLRAQDAGRRSEFNPTTGPSAGPSAAPSAGVTPLPSAGPTAPAPGTSTRPAGNWNGGFGATSGGRSNSNNTDNGSSRQDYSRNRRDSRRGGRDRAGPTTSKTLSDAYSLVLTKSIFSRNRQTTSGSDPVSYPTGPTAPTNSPLVFNGVVEADGAMVAFVEDTGGGQISQYRLGDRIGRGGRITSISLDALEIETDGKRHQVRVGQTLDGGEAPSLTERAVISNGPAESGTPSPTPAGPNSDILAKLKARRAAELAGRGAPPGAPGGTPPGGTPPPGSTPPPGGAPQR